MTDSIGTAATLPPYSIVACRADVFLKLEDRDTNPWVVTGGYGWFYGDDEIDDLLRSGEATILRVGDGAS